MFIAHLRRGELFILGCHLFGCVVKYGVRLKIFPWMINLSNIQGNTACAIFIRDFSLRDFLRMFQHIKVVSLKNFPKLPLFILHCQDYLFIKILLCMYGNGDFSVVRRFFNSQCNNHSLVRIQK